jgi:hypothetical protein
MDDMTKALVGVIVALVSCLVAALRRKRHAPPAQAHSERLMLLIDERVLHKLSNFVMWYRPVFEATARGDADACSEALDRVAAEIREQARLTSDRLRG